MSGWLIDTLLYTGLLIALVLVLRRPAGRFFGPQLAYGLWALPFLRLLLPPIVLPASLAPEPAAAPVATAAEWTPVVMEMPVEATLATATVTGAPATLSAPPAWEWADLIAPAVSLWAGVALAFLAFRVVTYRRMRRELLRGARPVGEIGKVRLVESPALASPVAFGVFDKVIALPPQFMARHDVAARDLAIAHELAHHRGHDLLANFAAQALLALHWFNPIAWMGWRAMRRDQEAACDARVLAGRGREDRVRYAALIAEVATGPRLALAAPMACPVLGERSIVHRLRSLSMSEMSPRRRWFGRTLFTAGALALPLTASISYAVAQVPPAPPIASIDPDAPEAPEAPEARDGDERHVRTIVIRRDGEDGEPIVRRFVMRHPPGAPGAAPTPQFNFHGEDFDSEEFQRGMEEFQREMEQFRAEWTEKHGEEWAQWAEQHRGQALAMAEQARRMAPEVVHDCNQGDNPVRTSRSDDGRQRIVICNVQINRMANTMARSSLRSARNAIAQNREMSDEVRREVLEDLDEEIERIERKDD